MKTATANYSKNVSFTDAKGQTVFIEIEIKDGRLSMCGNIAGHGAGQCQDSISPADDNQRELIEIWNTFHLNDMHAGTPDQERALKSEEFETFYANYKRQHAEAVKIERIAEMSLSEYVTFIDAWKLTDNQNKTLKSYPIACKDDFDTIQKIFKAKHANGRHFERMRDKLYMGEQKFPFKDVDFEVLGTTPISEILAERSPSHYTAAVAYLKSKSLYTVSNNGQPYTYGSAWLKQELPENIIERIDYLVEQIGGAFTGSPYEKQANDFLKKHGVKFSAKFKEHAKYFQDDQEERDVFTCTFRRGKDHFSITFGQSLNQTTGTGANLPTSYDVLACLTKSDPEDLKTFCDNFGYSDDSISARRIYKSVCKEWAKVNAFFSAEELEELQNIQ